MQRSKMRWGKGEIRHSPSPPWGNLRARAGLQVTFVQNGQVCAPEQMSMNMASSRAAK